MKERDVVLDIGIGTGGSYIQGDGSKILRVGLDIDRTALRLLKRRYPLDAVMADASGEDAGLPFGEKSLKHIDIILPQDELLYGLCYSDYLWLELNRVLKPKESVRIVLDDDLVSRHAVMVHGQAEFIPDPTDIIARIASRAGFSIEIGKLSHSQTSKLGTVYAESIGAIQEKVNSAAVNEITAKKIRNYRK